MQLLSPPEADLRIIRQGVILNPIPRFNMEVPAAAVAGALESLLCLVKASPTGKGQPVGAPTLHRKAPGGEP